MVRSLIAVFWILTLILFNGFILCPLIAGENAGSFQTGDDRRTLSLNAVQEDLKQLKMVIETYHPKLYTG